MQLYVRFYLTFLFFFFFNDTATTEIYTLSLHDALPIYHLRLDHLPLLDANIETAADGRLRRRHIGQPDHALEARRPRRRGDRKSTRLNSSHANISYAVFCLKKKKNITYQLQVDQQCSLL